MKPLVPPGAPIAVVAPSHAFDPQRLDAGLTLARAAGLRLECFPDLLRPHRYFAAADEQRLAQLSHALTSPEYGAVWIVRGGSGMTRLLHRLPWASVRRRPVIGFSDVTPLLHEIGRRWPTCGIHGPVLHSLADTDPADREALFDLLAGRPIAALRGLPWREGGAEGRLVGGNLTMLAASCGTPFQPDTRGAVLFLEEIGEAPYRVDRMLQQLHQAGMLDRVRGIALGSWAGCEAPADAGWTLEDVLREQLLPLGVPVLAGLPFGHASRNQPLLVGALARIDGPSFSQPPRRT